MLTQPERAAGSSSEGNRPPAEPPNEQVSNGGAVRPKPPATNDTRDGRVPPREPPNEELPELGGWLKGDRLLLWLFAIATVGIAVLLGLGVGLVMGDVVVVLVRAVS